MNKGYDKILINGVKGAVEGVALDLEKIARKLSRDLPHIKADKLPEYNQALESIRNYKTALGNKINSLYQNSK
jgi:hypothetical protein